MSLAHILRPDRDDRTPRRSSRRRRAGHDRRPSSRRARRHGVDRIRLVLAAIAVLLAWALAQFRLPRAAARAPAMSAALSLGLIAARGCAVAAQVLHPLDGDQLLRCPDHRFRHRQPSCSRSFRTFASSSSSAAVLIAAPLLVIMWRIDPFRVPRLRFRSPARSACASLPSPACRSQCPEEPWEQFQGINHVSTFVRSGVTTAYELSTKGWIDFDTTTSDQLRAAADEPCHPAGKPPNIIMVLDEASFDACAVPGIKLPPGYGGHFQSFDGKKRSLIVEGLRRADLVHRIQCADRPVGAVLRPLELLRHPHCRRPRQARPAAGAAALRLQDHLALSGLRRVPQRARNSRRPPASAAFSIPPT